MAEVRLHPQRERDLRYCLTVLAPEADRLLNVMEESLWPWQVLRWRRAHREVRAIQKLWHAINEGEEHAPDGQD